MDTPPNATSPAPLFAAPIYHSTVEGLGYALVDVERLPAGLLRVTIENKADTAGLVAAITIDDCERVTRQLQFVLAVEGIDYHRLEVSSPGVDRPLRSEADLLRHLGENVTLTLKEAIETLDASGKSTGKRKRFTGCLGKSAQGFEITWTNEPPRKPGARRSIHAQPSPLQQMRFAWHEIQEARLAPVLNFKGRSAAQPAAIERK